MKNCLYFALRYMISFKIKFTVASSLVLLIASTSAAGINCRGSGQCSLGTVGHTLVNIKDIVDRIQPRDRHYDTGQQIACAGSLCAFYQNGAGGTADDTSSYLQALIHHKCKTCGSVPTQSGNNIAAGALTVNVVGQPKCQGAC
ncbi:hypothetical protein N7526_008486 [Penicillium atrosanguineum]|nr:hypothetical protein N7526_008486 [Penicillium atrosanguineum]